MTLDLLQAGLRVGGLDGDSRQGSLVESSTVPEIRLVVTSVWAKAGAGQPEDDEQGRQGTHPAGSDGNAP